MSGLVQDFWSFRGLQLLHHQCLPGVAGRWPWKFESRHVQCFRIYQMSKSAFTLHYVSTESCFGFGSTHTRPAVYGVAQSRTRLKRLSSSSSIQSTFKYFCENSLPEHSVFTSINSIFFFAFQNVCMLSHFSHVWLFETPWTSRLLYPWGFSRQEYWSELPCPPSVIFPIQGFNPCLLCLLNWQVGSLPLAPLEKPRIHILDLSEILFTDEFLILIKII